MNPVPLFLIIVTLPLLLGGCGSDKKEPVAETIVDPIVNLLSKEELARAYDFNKLEEREGLEYLKGSETPYTGIGFELYENGQRAWEYEFKEGKVIRVTSFDEKGKMTSNLDTGGSIKIELLNLRDTRRGIGHFFVRGVLYICRE